MQCSIVINKKNSELLRKVGSVIAPGGAGGDGAIHIKCADKVVTFSAYNGTCEACVNFEVVGGGKDPWTVGVPLRSVTKVLSLAPGKYSLELLEAVLLIKNEEKKDLLYEFPIIKELSSPYDVIVTPNNTGLTLSKKQVTYWAKSLAKEGANYALEYAQLSGAAGIASVFLANGVYFMRQTIGPCLPTLDFALLLHRNVLSTVASYNQGLIMLDNKHHGVSYVGVDNGYVVKFMTGRLDFPNMDVLQDMAKSITHVVKFNSADLAEALEEVISVADVDYCIATFKVDGAKQMATIGVGGQQAKATNKMSAHTDAKAKFTVGLNAQFLKHLLVLFEDSVYLGYTKDGGPCFLSAENNFGGVPTGDDFVMILPIKDVK